MLVFPNAKINLGLHVIAKRTDGFHDIETVFYPVKGLVDILEILPDNALSLRQSGIAIEGSQDDNLCIKAYKMLAADFELPAVQIFLHKIIPAGGGLGGGSADASFTLSCLNKLFDLNLDVKTLKSYARRLGSDCAFFIDNQASTASGRGEILMPLSVNLQGLSLFLVKPDVHVNTAEAYSGITPRKPDEALAEIIADSVNTWKGRLVNDFETSVFRRFPEIGVIKNKLYDAGAIYAAMSGSGATVFGLFEQNTDLVKLRDKFNDCWTYDER